MSLKKCFLAALVGAAFIASVQMPGMAQSAVLADAAKDLEWRLIGPFRGGWATVVTGVPSKPDTFYFGAAGGGVWRSDNAGRTWTSIFDHGGAASIGALAVSSSDPRVIYVGTGQAETRYDVAAGSGVFRSSDEGKSWTPVGFSDSRHIGKIWIDPKNPNLVLVGVQGHFFGPSSTRGVYRSTNGGKTWSQTLRPDNDWTGVTDIASDPKNPRVLFASTWEAHQFPWLSYFTPTKGAGSGVYKSTDEGLTWKRLSGNGWPTGALGRIGLAATHTAKGTRVYATVDSESAGGLYRSDDGGAHWARVNAEKSFTSSYASRLTVEPSDPDTVFTVGQSIRRCSKGGSACEIVKGAPGGDDYHHIWINPLHPDHVITGSDQGAVVSVDGWKSWSSWYNQPTGQFYHLAADNRFPYWIYSGQQDSGTVGIASRSDYGTITWRDWHPVGGDERDYDIPDPRDPDIVYDSGLGGRVTRFDGRTGQIQDIAPWPVSSYGKRPTLVRYHYLWATPLVPSQTGPFTLYLASQLLFRTQDGGRHWKTISGDLTGKTANAKNCGGDTLTLIEAKTCGYGTISAIAPSPRAAGEVWVGTDDGLIQLTRDGGAHWSDVTPHGLALWAKVREIDVSATQFGVAYAAIDMHRLDDFAPHILRTRDYGKSWQEIGGGLPAGHFVNVVRADPRKAGLLYVGTDVGTFVSFDDGARWSQLGQGLPTAWVTDLLVHGNDLLAATEGRAIWSLDDVASLRDAVAANQSAWLFRPANAIRVHDNMNSDTPLPPETPMSPNRPGGAYIDYWLAGRPAHPLVLEIRDAKDVLVRRFASDAASEHPDARRYFAAGWTSSPQQLPASAGFHRFVWNLRYERPLAIRYGYGIGGVWGRGTPIEPQGPFVLPGAYRVRLIVDGRTLTAPLDISEDPRVRVSPTDLAASLDLSRTIAGASAEARTAYAESEYVKKQLKTLFPETPSGREASSAKKNVLDPLRALADKLRAKPVPGAPTFESVDSTFTGIETDLESADVAPTEAQRAVIADARQNLSALLQNWTSLKRGPLATLDAGLVRAGRRPIVIPSGALLTISPVGESQELP